MSEPNAQNAEFIQRLFGEFIQWHNREYAAPSPPFIKQTVLLRNGIKSATWVETGTFQGDTTHVLSRVADFVYSLEPEPTLYQKAVARFQDTNNVNIINGTSEDVFPVLLPTIRGDVCFWLDGHFSAGATFKGAQDTPIADELREITANLARFNRVAVLVDDVRCFNPQDPNYTQYPTPDFLVTWACANRLRWHIEHDIFVAVNF